VLVFSQLGERVRSSKTRWNIMAAFRSFIAWLYKRDDIQEMPREFPWPEVEETAPTVLTAAAQAEILKVIPEPDRGIFLAMALMGIRLGEAVALDLGDYRDGWLTVQKARKGSRLDSPIRGMKARRVKRIPVPDPVRDWIEGNQELLMRIGPSRGVSRSRAVPPVPPSDSPLFPNPRTGDRWIPTSLRRAWRKASGRWGSRSRSTKEPSAPSPPTRRSAGFRSAACKRIWAKRMPAPPSATRGSRTKHSST
jgi:integrase